MQIPTFPDFFDIFGMFQTMFIFIAFISVLIFVIVVVVIVKVCRQSAEQMAGGFVIEPPSFVIPDRQGRSDGPEMKTVRLPDRCPSCNAALSHEGIDWVGPMEAKCNYCGGTVKARFENV